MMNLKLSASLMILGACFTTSALALDVDLCVGAYDENVVGTGGTETVRMWGYSVGMPDNNGVCVGLSSPGPQVVVPVGDSILNVTLHNTLSVPTSLVMPGTLTAMSPVLFMDARGRQRVRSFTHEAAVGGSAVYHWGNLQSGTYLYHSGTNPALQVQMGLAGAVTHDADVNTAYSGQMAYDRDVVVIYSEVDRRVHAAVASGIAYDQSDNLSTVDSRPNLFKVSVNGSAYNAAQPLDVGVSGNKVLLRVLNSGYKTRVPTILNAGFDLLAEDGKAYPSVRLQHSMLLPGLKTRDALLRIDDSAGAGGRYTIYDGSMTASTVVGQSSVAVAAAAGGSLSSGGSVMLTLSLNPSVDYVAAVSSGVGLVAQRDHFSVQEGGSILSLLKEAVSNDLHPTGVTVEILSAPSQGSLLQNGVDNAALNGYQGLGYDYQHDGSEVSRDALVYALVNPATGERSIAGITIEVVPVNDPPIAVDDVMTVTAGQTVELRVLENDYDAEGYSLAISNVGSGSLANSVVLLDRVLIYTATNIGSDVLTYTVVDIEGATAQAQVNLTVVAAAASSNLLFVAQPTVPQPTVPQGTPPTAVNDRYKVVQGGSLTVGRVLGLLANDSPAAMLNTTLLAYPQSGTVTLNADGSFVYTHDGSVVQVDQFEYEVYNDFGTSKAVANIDVTALNVLGVQQQGQQLGQQQAKEAKKLAKQRAKEAKKLAKQQAKQAKKLAKEAKKLAKQQAKQEKKRAKAAKKLAKQKAKQAKQQAVP